MQKIRIFSWTFFPGKSFSSCLTRVGSGQSS
uniref:Uncharacterized protein n=1 Tax=Rhizophora mucronata TaxID=61149 RepID=A0A2P2Q560_RHIMU